METILNSFLLKSIIYSLLFYIVYKLVFALCGVFRKPKTKAKKNSKKGYRKPQKNQELVSKKVLTKDEIIMLDALEQVANSITQHFGASKHECFYDHAKHKYPKSVF